MRGRVELRILVRDPVEEPSYSGIGSDRAYAVAEYGELGVGKGSMQGSVADRVDRNGHPAPAALGDRVMIFEAAAEFASTQPAVLSWSVVHGTTVAGPRERQNGRVLSAVRKSSSACS